MLILASVSLNLIVGEDGILKKATQAKETMEFASMKEKLSLEIMAIHSEALGTTLRESEVLDKLVEKGVISEKGEILNANKNYTLNATGNILCEGVLLDHIQLSDNPSVCSIETSRTTGGTLEKYQMSDIKEFRISCYSGKVEDVSVEGEHPKVRLKAFPAPSGKKFAYWVNGYSGIVSYKAETVFNVAIPEDFVAVYVSEDKEIAPSLTISVSSYRMKVTHEDIAEYIMVMSHCEKNGANYKRIGFVYRSKEPFAKSVLRIGESNTMVYWMGNNMTDNIVLQKITSKQIGLTLAYKAVVEYEAEVTGETKYEYSNICVMPPLK